MNVFAYRNKILAELRRESNASFFVIYRAMCEARDSSPHKTLDVEDVKQRIRDIVRNENS